jgi:hypothetical protein
MKAMKDGDLAQFVRNLGRSWALRLAACLLVAELLLGVLFGYATDDDAPGIATGVQRGLFDASGHPNVLVAVVGLFYLVLRVTVTMLLPPLVAFVLVRRMARHIFNETA